MFWCGWIGSRQLSYWSYKGETFIFDSFPCDFCYCVSYNNWHSSLPSIFQYLQHKHFRFLCKTLYNFLYPWIVNYFIFFGCCCCLVWYQSQLIPFIISCFLFSYWKSYEKCVLGLNDFLNDSTLKCILIVIFKFSLLFVNEYFFVMLFWILS